MSTTTKAAPSGKTGGSAGNTAAQTAGGIKQAINQAGGGQGSGSPLAKAAQGANKLANKAQAAGAGNKNNPQSATGQKTGDKIAGGLNKGLDKASEKGAKAAGQYFGGSAGGKAAEAAMKMKNKFEKKITGGNEEARLALRIAEQMGPAGLAVIGAFLFILLIIILIMTIFGGGSASGKSLLTLTKTGPDTAIQGQSLDYQINVSYSGSAQDIIVQDPIPVGTDFDKTTPPPAQFDPITRTVTWDLKNIIPPQNGLISNVNTNLALRLTATANNNFLVNQAQGFVIGETTTGNNGNGTSPPNTSATDFTTLMTGQGRNVAILGDENAFVASVLKNGAKLATGFSSGSYAPQLHQIYQQAAAKNVNPLIIVTIWGVEAGFNLNNTEFGCNPFGSGFTSQLSCSVNTLDHWMLAFDQTQKNGSISLTGCPPFTDAFIYAYEYYTPVCHSQDGNDASRRNFVLFFKTLFGVN